MLYVVTLPSFSFVETFSVAKYCVTLIHVCAYMILSVSLLLTHARTHAHTHTHAQPHKHTQTDKNAESSWPEEDFVSRMFCDLCLFFSYFLN